MEIIELSFFLLLATAFTMLVAFCVIAVIIVILIDYGKPKGDKNGNRRNIS